MRPLNRLASSLAVTLIALASVTMPAGAADYRRHYAHHRHSGYRVASSHVSPDFAPPPPVNGGLAGLSGPLLPGYPVGGGVLGTGVSNGTGLLGIGFFGL